MTSGANRAGPCDPKGVDEEDRSQVRQAADLFFRYPLRRSFVELRESLFNNARGDAFLAQFCANSRFFGAELGAFSTQ